MNKNTARKTLWCPLVILPTVLFAGPTAAGSCPTGAAITLADLTAVAPSVPADLCTNATHTQLANFAWREFIALSNLASPNLPKGRGMPAPGKSFADSGGSGDGPLVWETFAHRTEMLPAAATSLPPWGSKPPEYIYTTITVSGTQANYNNLDESTEIGQNQMFFPTNPPNPAMAGKNFNPDADQQILYEAKVNQTEYDHVKNNLSTLFPASPTNPFRLAAGSIEVKAGWREVNSTIDASRYHTSTVTYYESGLKGVTPKTKTYALVGLHIIHKTSNYPTFIFASFEQVDAMTTPSGSNTGLYYVANYDTVAYKGATPSNNAPQASFPTGSTSTGSKGTGSGITTVDLPVGDLAAFYAGQSPKPASGSKGIPSGLAGPITVIQEPLISNDVVAVNKNVLKLMQGSGLKNSVWQYYQLKGIQGVSYPTKAYPTPTNGVGGDFYLANIVIESSQPGVQLFSGSFTAGPAITGTPPKPVVLGVTVNQPNVTNPHLGASGNKTYLMGGCQGCHGNAQQSGFGFSFLLLGGGTSSSKGPIKGFDAPDAKGLPHPQSAKLLGTKYPAHQP